MRETHRESCHQWHLIPPALTVWHPIKAELKILHGHGNNVRSISTECQCTEPPVFSHMNAVSAIEETGLMTESRPLRAYSNSMRALRRQITPLGALQNKT